MSDELRNEAQDWESFTEIEELNDATLPLEDEPNQDETVLYEASGDSSDQNQIENQGELEVTQLDPERLINVSEVSPNDIQLSKNLDTISHRVKHPVMKHLVEGYREGLRRRSPIAFAVGVALRESIENAIPSRQSKIESAARQLVGVFGKNGQYSGATFNYDTRGRSVRIFHKDGRPAYEKGKLSPDLSPKQLELIKALPDRVKEAKAELASEKTAQKTTAKSQSKVMELSK